MKSVTTTFNAASLASLRNPSLPIWSKRGRCVALTCSMNFFSNSVILLGSTLSKYPMMENNWRVSHEWIKRVQLKLCLVEVKSNIHKNRTQLLSSLCSSCFVWQRATTQALIHLCCTRINDTHFLYEHNYVFNLFREQILIFYLNTRVFEK